LERRNVLTPEEIASVDASYRPIDEFEAWADLPLDVALWHQYADRLREQRRQLGDRGLDRAVRGAMRAAAFDSGAIEGLYPADRGFTITAAFQASAWEAGLRERGAVTEELVAGQLRGYELALDAATKRLPISEAWIRTLHEEVSAGQQTYTVRTAIGTQEHALPRGVYKIASNHVLLTDGRFHAYAPPTEVPSEMHRLVTEMGSPRFEAAHPVLQAAYAHHALTQIHPFADGNGRVARILASVFLFRAESIPLVVFAGQRETYLEALRRADGGDRSVFVDFLLDRSIDTLDLLSNLLAADSQASIDRLAGFYRVAEGITQEHLERAIVALLKGPVVAEIQAQLNALPTGVSGGVGYGQIHQETDIPVGYRVVTTPQDPTTVLYVSISTAPPYQAQINLRLRPLLALEPTSSMPVMLDELWTKSSLRARVSDIVPELGEGLQARLQAWVSGVMARALQQLVADAERARERG
jgi:Fic family protein